MRAGRSLISWSLYDWASSPVPTLHATFIFSVYFTTAVMPDGGTAAWAWMTSATAFLVAVTAPVLGRLADRHGWLKACLGTVTLIGAATTAGLWFVRPDPHYAVLALGLSAASIFAMEIAFVFYNALLPSVASEQEYGRASGLAWGLGYVGAIIALGLVLLLFVLPEEPALVSARTTRRISEITMCFAALWLVVFALPLFLFVRQPAARTTPPFLASLRQSIGLAIKIPDMARFLLARMLFADGLVTLFAFGGIYAATVFGLSQTMVLVFGILLNITAGIGAAGGGFADDRFGSIAVMRGCLVALAGLGSAAVLAPNEAVFWMAGAALGLFIGRCNPRPAPMSRAARLTSVQPVRTDDVFRQGDKLRRPASLRNSRHHDRQ